MDAKKPRLQTKNLESGASFYTLFRSIFDGFKKQEGKFSLLELDRGRRLTGAVVEHAVDVLDLIDDAAGDSTQHVPGHIVALGGHEVSGGDSAQGHGVVVGALVAHDADAVHIGQSRIILADLLIEAGLGDLLTPDGVGVLHDRDLLGGHFADDADAQTGAGEGLAADQILGQTQLTASLTDFVLEQVAQRLDQLLEVHGVRQAADVVVALDDGGLTAQTALDDIGVNSTLCEEIDLADLLCLFLKDADELLADDLALALRLGDTGQLCKVAVTGVHADEVDVKAVGVAGAEDRADLFLLVLAQQAVVYEHAGQLLADGLGQHGSQHGGIDAAGQGAEHLAAADALFQGLDVVLHEGVHFPVAGAAADVVHEVVQHLLALSGVEHLGVELDGVQPLFLVLSCGYRAVDGVGSDFEAGRSLLDIVVVAHPADGGGLHIGEHLAAVVHEDLGLAVLALRSAADMAAQQVHHELTAVADAQHRYAPAEDLGVDGGRILQIDAVGASGEDDALGVLRLDDGQVRLIGIDLTVDIILADAARDELIVLAAKVQHDHGFMLHDVLLSLYHWCASYS